MPVRKVLRYPHPALKRAVPLRDLGDPLIEEAVTDLLDTMRAHHKCVGLAAPQLGIEARVIVVDVSEHPKTTKSHGLLQLVNPRVTLAEGGEVGREGCLSVPELTANVRRATRVIVDAYTPPGGKKKTIDTEGWEARCLQHEIDHLDGILFLDRVDSLATDVFRRKKFK